MNVRAEAGTYHMILGMLPLNKPFVPSIIHTRRIASDHPLYLKTQQYYHLLQRDETFSLHFLQLRGEFQ